MESLYSAPICGANRINISSKRKRKGKGEK